MRNLKKASSIIRTILATVFLGLLLWFMMPAIIDIGTILGGIICISGFLVTVFWDKFKLLWNHISKNSFGKWFLRIIATIIAFGFVYVVVISAVIVYAANKTPDTTSTAVVLGCKVDGTNPSLMLTRRLEAAEEYLEKNPNVVCIVSGGQGYNEGISEAQCMYNYLTEHGIEKDRIIMEDKSTTTSENMQFSKKIIEEKGLNKNIAIITDGFHEYRASIIAKEVGLNPTGAVSAKTDIYLLAAYHFRETIAIANELIF